MKYFALLLLFLSGCTDDHDLYIKEINNRRERVDKCCGEQPEIKKFELKPYEIVLGIADKTFNHTIYPSKELGIPTDAYKIESLSSDKPFIYYSLKLPQKEDSGAYYFKDVVDGDCWLVVPFIKISRIPVKLIKVADEHVDISLRHIEYSKQVKEWETCEESNWFHR